MGVSQNGVLSQRLGRVGGDRGARQIRRQPHFRGSIASGAVIRALRHFRHKIGRPLLVVWDRLNAHRARRAAAFLTATDAASR